MKARVPVGQRPRGLAFSRDGRKLFATSENDAGIALLDPAAAWVIRHLPLPDAGLRPMGVVATRDGKDLYVSTGRGAQLLHLRSDLTGEVQHVAVGARPWGLALSPDERDLISADGPSDSVSIVDRVHFTRRATLKVGTKPWGVVTLHLPPHSPPAPHP